MKALDLLIEWKRTELGATDCGGPFEYLGCAGCTYYSKCVDNADKLKQLNGAIADERRRIEGLVIENEHLRSKLSEEQPHRPTETTGAAEGTREQHE